ncbi:MAG: exodeoxyribonuclease V subunit alpha [Desulfamplus sp.]|nr:exodeoxyribonuclease V subunit alpha [Desulfamplus sp.]
MIMSREILTIVDSWSDRGWLRPLDRAFVQFIKSSTNGVLNSLSDTSGLVVLAGALTSHQLGRGHVCLDLEDALKDPDSNLSLPPEGESGEFMPPKPSEILSEIPEISVKMWEASLLKESVLITTGSGNTPLVLDNGRLYLRRYWQYTIQVAADIRKRIANSFRLPDNLCERLDKLFSSLRSEEERNKTAVHWQSVAAAIAAKSGFTIISGGPGTGKTTTVIQILGLLQGLAFEQGQKLRIHLAAPTGKAAARLTESIGSAVGRLPANIRETLPTKVTTLHKLLGSRLDTRHFIHNQANKLNLDLLVIDEASMIDLEMMAAVMSALPDSARLILLGDKDQLSSVEAGSVLGDLCRNAENNVYTNETCQWIKKYTGYSAALPDADNTLSGQHIEVSDNTLSGQHIEVSDNTLSGQHIGVGGTLLDQHIVVLRKSHRFGDNSGIGSLARAVNGGDPDKTQAVWEKGFGDISSVSIKTTDDKAFTHLVLESGYRSYLKIIADRPKIIHDSQENGLYSEEDWLRAVLSEFACFQLLTPLRKGMWGVEGLNKKTAEMLYKEGLIPAIQGWYPGRPVMVLRNDYSLGLMNGDVGILLPVMGTLKVVFPMSDGSLKKVLPSRLNDVETVYAMTVHKSQGSEFDHTALVLPDKMSPVLTRELIYTGITRAKSRFTLVTPIKNILGESVKRRTHRASGLGDILHCQ